MAKQPQECGCGCGGMTKGGRFLPGHDARFHAAQKAGNLGKAIAHHQTVRAPVRAVKEQATEPIPEGEGTLTGKGTTVQPGMWVRATVSGKPSEGIVFSVDHFGNIAFVDEEGKQHIGYTGMTWVVDPSTKRKPNTAQRRTLDNIGRYVPSMMKEAT